MSYASVLFLYVWWHYTRAIKEGFFIWKNFIIAIFNFFSVSLLFRTFFSRFERMGEDYKKGFNIGENLSTFVINTLMRIVGMGIRSIVIIVGLLCVLLAFLFGIILGILWMLFPLLFITSIVVGINKII